MGKGKGSKCYYYITKECEALRYNRRVENNTSNNLDVLKITPLNSDRRVKNNTSNNKLFNIDSKLNNNIDNKEIEWFLKNYHSICVSLPKVMKLSEKRKKAIRKILDTFSKDNILECFELAEQSDFLKGNNDRGWKADIDFILREDKFINILEGKYGGRVTDKKKFNLEGNTDPYTDNDRISDEQWRKEMNRRGTTTRF